MLCVLYNEVHNVHCCTGVQYCKTNYCTDVQYCTTDSPEYLVHCVCVTEYDHSGVLYTVEQIYPSTQFRTFPGVLRGWIYLFYSIQYPRVVILRNTQRHKQRLFELSPEYYVDVYICSTVYSTPEWSYSVTNTHTNTQTHTHTHTHTQSKFKRE